MTDAPPDGRAAPPGAAREVPRLVRMAMVEVGGAALAGGLSLVVAAAVLRLWAWHPTVPLSYSSDALYYQEIVKGTLDHGWYLRNPDLGAPFGLASHDFPIVGNDSLQLLIVKVMGVFTKQPFLVTNAFYLLTYVLNPVGAYVALRWRRLPRALAVFGAALFGILPLHFMKGVDHLFFSSYYMVPLGAALVLTVLAGEPVFGRRSVARSRLGSWATIRSGLVVLICAAIASASIYYAIFTMILLVAASMGRGLVHRSLRPMATGLVAAGTIAAFTVLNQLPTILYRLGNGPNLLAAVRSPAEGEYYGLKLIQVLLPVPGHRFEPFADLADRYRSTTMMLGEPSMGIGVMAAIGLGWLLVVALASIMSSRGSSTLGADDERNAAFALMVVVVWASTGGLSPIFNYTITPQFRGWGRMSLFVAFFAIVGLVHLLGRAGQWLSHGRARPPLVALLAGLFLLAALDQTSPRFTPDHQAMEAAYHADADFVRTLEGRMPDGAAILQLPYVPYPENPPVHGMSDYDHMRPYLHSKHLRWSYGAMKGRPEDWHAELSRWPLGSLLAGAAAGGFQGLVVDRAGYADRAAGLQSELTSLLGPPALSQRTDRLVFWDLAAVSEGLAAAGRGPDRLAELAMRPTRLVWGHGFDAQESQAGIRFRWMQEEATLGIENPDEVTRTVVFTVRVRTGIDRAASTTFHFPDGGSDTVESGGAGTEVHRVMDVPPGRSAVTIDHRGPPVPTPPTDDRRLLVQVVNPAVVPVELCPPADPPAGAAGEAGCVAGSRAHLP